MSRILKSQIVNLKPSHFLVQNIDEVKEVNEEDSDKVEDNSEQDKIENLVAEAEQYCTQIINDAKQQKEDIVKKAREEAELLKNKAKEDGYKEGRQLGYNQGMKEIEVNLNEAIAIKEKAKIEYNSTLYQLEKDIVNLSLGLIAEVLNNNDILTDGYMINIISKGLEKLNYSSSAIIRVSEADFENVNKSKKKILAMAERIDSIDIIIDLALNKGDCLIDTPIGNVDCGIKTQLDKLCQVVQHLMDNR